MNSSNSCHLCGTTNTSTFFDLPPIPTMDGVMSKTKEEALNVPTGKVQLQHCVECGFIQNNGYDSNKVSFDTYDFANDYSPSFREFIENLANRLVNKYNLHSKNILEIASGDGHFLHQICKIGNNTGIGFDPGFKYHGISKQNPNVRFINEYYSEKDSDHKPDLLVCRQLINLIDTSRPFLQMIRKNLQSSPDTLVYIEVPNAEYTFREKVYWNLSYEHGAWFTASSLQTMMKRCHFEVLETFTCWNDEFLGIIARPAKEETGKNEMPKLNGMARTISQFSTGFDQLLQKQKAELIANLAQGKKVVAWGAGARAVTYFNLLETNGSIPYIVDINVNRHGKFLPGSGTKIIAPEFLQKYRPEVVLITNPTYSKEITAHIRTMGINPKIITL